MKLFFEYLRTRMGLSRFGIVAAFLALASFVDSGPGELSVLAWLGRACGVWFLLIPLRLRDDLAALEHDRVHHPERVLCRHKDLSVFVRATSFLPVLGLFGLWYTRGMDHTGLWFFLVALSEFFYRSLGRKAEEGIWMHLLVLLKYPVLVALLQSQPFSSLSHGMWATCLLVYITFCIFELLDAGTLSASPKGPWVLWGECTVAGALCAFLLARQLSEQSALLWAVGMLPWWGLAFVSVRLLDAETKSLKVAPVSFGLAFAGLAWIVVNS